MEVMNLRDNLLRHQNTRDLGHGIRDLVSFEPLDDSGPGGTD